MNLTQQTLQRHFDGELSSEESARVEQALPTATDGQDYLRVLGKVQGFIRMDVEEAAREIDADALFAGIEAQVARTEDAPLSTDAQVHSLDSARRRRRGPRIVATAAIVAAIAAAVAIGLRPRSDGPVENATAVSTVAAPRPLGSEVVEVDFGTNTGTVFAVQGERGEELAVVWISEDPDTTNL